MTVGHHFLITNCITVSLTFWFCFLVRRMTWVYVFTLECIARDVRIYHRLPSFNSMLWRVWIWDVKKFLPEDLRIKGD